MSIEARSSRWSGRMFGMALALHLAGCGALLGFDDDYKVAKPDGSVAPPDAQPGGSDAAEPEAGPSERGQGNAGGHAGMDSPRPDAGSTDKGGGKTTVPVVPADAGPDSSIEGDDDGGIAGCTPSFEPSNGIVYPTHFEPILDITVDPTPLDTTPGMSPLCSSPDGKYCVVAADEIRIRSKVRLGVRGTRPLVMIAVHDIVLEDESMLNIAGGNGYSVAGPGDHELHSGKSPGGGGGGADRGAGNACGASGGDRVELNEGLVGGGNGAVRSEALNCIAGGRGGGAAQLISLCGKIEIGGYIDGSGGGGVGGVTSNRRDCPEGLGGGAGGLLWIQAKELSIIPGRVWIQLYGGGGGGGACFEGMTPVEATNADARIPGMGAQCMNGYAGGPGGTPGTGDMQPQIGGAPTTGQPGQGRASCGGGGGSRGRLVLQNVQQTCEDVAPANSGECIKVDP